MEITITLVFRRNDERRDVVVQLWETMEEILEREEICSKEMMTNDSKHNINTLNCYQMDYNQNYVHNMNQNYFSFDETNKMTNYNRNNSVIQQNNVRKNVDHFIVAHRGRIVNPIMSLLHEGITKNGSKLFVVEKAQNKSLANDKSNRQIQFEKELTKFGNDIKEYQKKVSSLRNNADNHSFDDTDSPNHKFNNDADDNALNEDLVNNEEKENAAFKDKLKNIKLNEILRISDQIWTTWETAKGHNGIVKLMMNQIDRNDPKNKNSDEQNYNIPMNTDRAKEICCRPLPNCFMGKPLNSYGILMAEYPETEFESSQPTNNSSNGYNPESSQF